MTPKPAHPPALAGLTAGDEDLCTGVDVLTETLARMLEGALADPPS